MNEINNETPLRYSMTMIVNGQEISRFAPFEPCASSLEFACMRRYEEVFEALRDHFGVGAAQSGESPPARLQQYRNHASALNGFISHVGKTASSFVGVEFGTAFDRTLRTYLEGLQLGSRTISDRRGFLRVARQLFEATKPGSSSRQTPVAEDFARKLRSAMAADGRSAEEVAEATGISSSQLERWLHGQAPSPKMRPALHRLEAAVGLARGGLGTFLGEVPQPQGAIPTSASPVIEYRERLRSLTKDAYVFPEASFSESLLAEWSELLKYKTAKVTALRRSARGVWACVPNDTVARPSALCRAAFGYCPTAGRFLSNLRSYLGFLMLSTDRGGLGRTPEAVQTIGWLCDANSLDAYLAFMAERSGGSVHTGHQVFCTSVLALLDEKHGYLRQCETLIEKLPENVRDGHSWVELCRCAADTLRNWKNAAIDVSRDPLEPIRGLLAADEPLVEVIAAVEKLRALVRKAPPRSLTAARHARDALLLALLISNPLRLRVFQHLRYSDDQTGEVYRTPGGEWRIRLKGSLIKNRRSERARSYDVRVAPWVSPLLDEYVAEYREILLQGNPGRYLFVARGRTGQSWKGLSRHVLVLTRRHVLGCPGIGCHAFRALVATEYLRRFPGDYLTVAELLNDKLSTVIRHYAHLQREDSHARYDRYLAELGVDRLAAI